MQATIKLDSIIWIILHFSWFRAKYEMPSSSKFFFISFPQDILDLPLIFFSSATYTYLTFKLSPHNLRQPNITTKL